MSDFVDILEDRKKDARIAELVALTAMLQLAAMDWAMQWYPSPEWDCRAAERITYLRIRAERSAP